MPAHHHDARPIVIILQCALHESAMEDGFIGGFVQRALKYNDDGTGIVMMGGHGTDSQPHKTSEAGVRGFWKH
ncbi:MAG: hypothetical protein AAF942_18550 [Pseudomonadota bacterium]